MSAALPYFRYHPDPIATGAVRPAAEPCACCGHDRGWIYTASFYTAQDVPGRFCPWCIADGSAAERFDGHFTDSYGLTGVSEDVLQEVTRRTPGFSAWQDPHWLVHCRDAAAFVGDLRLGGRHDEEGLELFLACLGEAATAMLFRCTACGTHLAYADAS